MMESMRLTDGYKNNQSPKICDRSLRERVAEIFVEYLPLPFITFGGPSAHVALLYSRFVVDKQWLTDKMFTEVFAISASLPGPASTQLAYTIALIRANIVPALCAFLIWSLPGAIIMALLGCLVGSHASSDLPLWVLFLENGLASAAVALVALAAYNLGKKLCKSNLQIFICSGTFCASVVFSTFSWLSPLCMIVGGLVALGANWCSASKNDAAAGIFVFDEHVVSGDEVEKELDALQQETAIEFSYSVTQGLGVIIVWFVILIGSIFLRTYAASLIFQLFGTLFYVGSIIFGGGPVVIPLLYVYIVTSDWAESSAFLLGLAIINCMPGPNFNFAAFCGALVMRKYGLLAGLGGAFVAWLAIFSPGLMIKTGILPLWRKHRISPSAQVLFSGVNPAAVGLVFGATFLLWQKALSVSMDGRSYGPFPLGSIPLFVAVAIETFIFVGFFKVPPPFMIVIAGFVGIAAWYVSAVL